MSAALYGSRPGNVFQIGDSYTVVVTGAASQPVTVSLNGSAQAPEGSTDASGKFFLSGTWTAGQEGAFFEQWYVGGVLAGSFSFVVGFGIPVTINAPLASTPQQFTNASTLINGQANVVSVLLFLNGLMLTEGLDYTRSGGLVTMVVAPNAGDVLTARVFAIGKALGGPNPQRYIAPWTLRLAGDFDGISTSYSIVFGPSISGALDGINGTFTVGVALQRMQIWRNGVLQTQNVDVAVGPTAMVFLAGAPQPGDIITLLGY